MFTPPFTRSQRDQVIKQIMDRINTECAVALGTLGVNNRGLRAGLKSLSDEELADRIDEDNARTDS